MLKRLRVKFVVIIMVLVGAVLTTVLIGSFVSAWQTQRNITNDSLERALNGSLYDLPRIAREEDDDHGGPPQANMLILAVDLDSDGIVLATNEAPLLIDSSTLSDVIANILASDKSEDWDDNLHIAWKRAQRPSGAWRVVIADTSAADLGLRSLAFRNAGSALMAMAALLLIAVGLSTWVLRPVEQAWRQQRQFVADASHELKTPLAVIIANTQILTNDPAITDDSRRWVQSTADESAHMKNLVEELLELARTDETIAGTTDVMQRMPIDFSSMVESSALEFDAIAFERGTLIEEVVEPDITVTGDPEWLRRLCNILIDNACKYSQGSEPVRVTLAREGRRCTLSVNNHGNVIDEKDLPHVFDRFYRTDKARSRDERTGGFGLGLAIAQGIADSHGGSIDVSSNAQDGTTFRVVLPIG